MQISRRIGFALLYCTSILASPVEIPLQSQNQKGDESILEYVNPSLNGGSQMAWAWEYGGEPLNVRIGRSVHHFNSG